MGKTIGQFYDVSRQLGDLENNLKSEIADVRDSIGHFEEGRADDNIPFDAAVDSVVIVPDGGQVNLPDHTSENSGHFVIIVSSSPAATGDIIVNMTNEGGFDGTEETSQTLSGADKRATYFAASDGWRRTS